MPPNQQAHAQHTQQARAKKAKSRVRVRAISREPGLHRNSKYQ